jgi:hypothetical protein
MGCQLNSLDDMEIIFDLGSTANCLPRPRGWPRDGEKRLNADPDQSVHMHGTRMISLYLLTTYSRGGFSGLGRGSSFIPTHPGRNLAERASDGSRDSISAASAASGARGRRPDDERIDFDLDSFHGFIYNPWPSQDPSIAERHTNRLRSDSDD